MRPEKWRLELSASKKRVLFGRVVHGEEDAECGQWWLFIYFIYIIIYLYIYSYNCFNKSCKPSYIISNMWYFNTIITRKKVQKKN